jgi:hypothetical protein
MPAERCPAADAQTGNSEACSHDSKAAHAKAADPETSHASRPQATDTKTTVAQAADSKTCYFQASDSETSNAEATDTETTDAQATDSKTCYTQAPDSETSNAEATDTETADAKASYSRPSDAGTDRFNFRQPADEPRCRERDGGVDDDLRPAAHSDLRHRGFHFRNGSGSVEPWESLLPRRGERFVVVLPESERGIVRIFNCQPPLTRTSDGIPRWLCAHR